MSNSLLNYFGRSKDGQKGEKRKAEQSSGETSSAEAKSRTSVSLKTLLKWQKELNMTIGYKVQNHSVTEMWCAVCREFAVERSSQVSMQLLKLLNFVGK